MKESKRDILQSYLFLGREIEEINRTIERETEQVRRHVHKLTKKKEALEERRANIEGRIDKVDNTVYRTILRGRYLNGQSMVSISQNINYSESRTYNLLIQAEEEVDL